MSSSPVNRPNNPRADGHRIEVRTYDGDLIRTVSLETAKELTKPGGLAKWTPSHVRLNPAIRWVSPRDAKRRSGRPDLDELSRREPDRYADNWSHSHDPHIGQGALGRSTVDSSLRISSLTK